MGLKNLSALESGAICRGLNRQAFGTIHICSEQGVPHNYAEHLSARLLIMQCSQFCMGAVSAVSSPDY